MEHDVNLVPLSRLGNKYWDKYVEADWNGDEEDAQRWYERYKDVKQRIKNGELYEIAF